MSGSSPNPDALLAALQRDENRQRRGRLKVFLGMSPGVGKTFAMLEAARREQASGRDLVIGYVESHGRAETDALAAGLPLVPRRRIEHRGVALEELDLDAILTRRPALAVVDELAHTNASDSRHPKRYQDIGELLDAGIDVFTTLNVQHMESISDTVREITGAPVHETVPDSVLDDAEIELVDLPPAELLTRLRQGKVYVPDRAATAEKSFFREGNLTALRELALRLAAEHVGQDTRQFRAAHSINRVWKTSPRLLVALSPSPLSESMARWTRRLADHLKAPWLAVYVDKGRPLSEDQQRRLQDNLALARELGAEVITTSDQDLVSAVLRVAHQHNVTQIVVGKPAGWRAWDPFRGGSMLGRLVRESGNIDILCVRAEGTTEPSPEPWRPRFDSSPRQYLVALAAMTATTGLNFAIKGWTGYYAPSLVYLSCVVVLALLVGRGPILLAASVGALLWNYLFLPPAYTFHISSFQDVLMFVVFFVVALSTGQLTARLRSQQLAEREREASATALYLLTRELAESKDLSELLGVVVRQLGGVFKADVTVLLPDRTELVAYPFGTLAVGEKDVGTAAWTFRNGKPAGSGTDTLASAEALFLPLAAPAGCIGVVALRFQGGSLLPLQQRGLLESFVRQIALVLDRQRLRDAEQDAKLLAESERLGKTLLNSISHELRTPLAAITSAASGLQESGALTGSQSALASEIREAADRLNRLVRNLLDVARLEAGHLRPRLDWCDPADLCQVAARSSAPFLTRRHLVLAAPPGLPLVKIDFVLMEQVLVNLLANAAIHTPADGPVELTAKVAGRELLIEVADRGTGLSETEMPRLFDKFFRSENARAGGTGLGLSIVKGFTEANGGRVTAANRPGGGALFTIRLPINDAPGVPEEPGSLPH